MLNRITVAGRLTHNPELRRTQSGKSVTRFSVAVDRDFKSQDGTRECDFIDVVAWESTAEFVSRYLEKGRMAVVDGRLQIRDYTGRDGSKKRAAEIIASSVYFGDSKPQGGQQTQTTQYGGQYGAPPPQYGGYGGGQGYGQQGGYGAAPQGGVPVQPAPVDPETGEYMDEDGDLPF